MSFSPVKGALGAGAGLGLEPGGRCSQCALRAARDLEQTLGFPGPQFPLWEKQGLAWVIPKGPSGPEVCGSLQWVSLCPVGEGWALGQACSHSRSVSWCARGWLAGFLCATAEEDGVSDVGDLPGGSLSLVHNRCSIKESGALAPVPS